MSFPLLFSDEIRGFYRSRLMLVLWLGLPLAAILIYALTPENLLADQPLSLSLFTALMVSTVAALLASVMLSVNLVNEIEDGSLDLFLVRPVRRWEILISKFLAVFICVVVASLIALGAGIGLDVLLLDNSLSQATMGLEDSLLSLFIVMGVSCSAALLISVFSRSVLVAVILVIFGANQLSALLLLPILLDLGSLEAGLAGLAISVICLLLSAIVFQRREL